MEIILFFIILILILMFLGSLLPVLLPVLIFLFLIKLLVKYTKRSHTSDNEDQTTFTQTSNPPKHGAIDVEYTEREDNGESS